MKADQLCLATEFDHGGVDLGRKAMHEGGALQEHCDVTNGDDIVDLEAGEAVLGLLETATQAFDRVERLVGFSEQLSGSAQLVALFTEDDGDAAALFRDRQNGEGRLSSKALGGAKSGSGLDRGDRRIRDEVHIRTDDLLGSVPNHDAAVHLRQFGHPLRGELGVGEVEPAAGNRVDGGPVPRITRAPVP